MSRIAIILPSLALLVACSDDHGHEHPHEEEEEAAHGHGHGDGVAIAITRWSEGLELFAEHPPVVVGEEAPLLAHLTWLPSFHSVDDARVRLTLEGPATVTAEVGMLRSGIYEVPMEVPAPGTYRGRIELIEGGEGAVGDFTIEAYPSQAAADEAHPPGAEEEDDGSIGFLKEQQWRVPFGTAFAEEGSVRPTVEVSGELTTPPSGTAHVHAPIAGRVLPPRRGDFVEPGTEVRAGTVLATIAPTPGAPEDATRANLAVVDATARVEESRAALERAERMLADRAIPERRVAEARRSLKVAEAAVGAARQSAALYRSAQSGRGSGSWRITAPIDGIVDAVNVSAGEAVGPDDVLFRIVDPSVLWLEVEIPERWAGSIARAAPTSFRLVGTEAVHVLGEEDASVVHFSRTVDPRTRTVRAVFRLEGTDDPSLRVGAAVQAAVPTGEPVSGVVVPASAVLEVDGRSLIYVQPEGESFEERGVRLGPRDGARVLVEAGVAAGERLVTEGAILVRLASQGSAGATGHGHVH